MTPVNRVSVTPDMTTANRSDNVTLQCSVSVGPESIYNFAWFYRGSDQSAINGSGNYNI